MDVDGSMILLVNKYTIVAAIVITATPICNKKEIFQE